MGNITNISAFYNLTFFVVSIKMPMSVITL